MKIEKENYSLYHSDALEYMRSLPDNHVDAVITDPPYSSGGNYRGDRMKTVNEKYIQSGSLDTFHIPFTGDNRDQRGFLVWCSMWLGEARRITKPGGVVACFIDWRQLPTLSDAIQCGGWVWRGMSTWWKPGIRMQKGRFSLSAEYVLIGSNGDITQGERSPQNVFKCKPVPGKDKNHIAEKPVEVVNWILGITPKDSLILDPFMGGGTTGESCAQLGRPFIGVEIDTGAFERAAKRIETAYAQKAMFS